MTIFEIVQRNVTTPRRIFDTHVVGIVNLMLEND